MTPSDEQLEMEYIDSIKGGTSEELTYALDGYRKGRQSMREEMESWKNTHRLDRVQITALTKERDDFREALEDIKLQMLADMQIPETSKPVNWESCFKISVKCTLEDVSEVLARYPKEGK